MIKPIGPDLFRSIVESQGGISKLNRYRVVMPTFFLGGDAITLDALCRSASIPGRTINTGIRRTNMKEIPTPLGYSNTQVDMIFTETTNFNVSRYVDEWMNKVVSDKTYEVGYREDIVRDILIMSTDEGGIPQYIVVLKNAFPKTKAQIDMSDNNENVSTEIRVAFEYEDYEIVNNPAIDGVQDGIRSLRAGTFKMPMNLIRGIKSDGNLTNRITGIL